VRFPRERLFSFPPVAFVVVLVGFAALFVPGPFV
jgi:hypothetical protein